MLIKLLSALCPLVVSSSLDQHLLTKPASNHPVQLRSNIGSVVIHNLCSDFTPNITNATCRKALFLPSEKLDFITITNQTMQLIPRSNDGACYIKNVFLCFDKTYQLTIGAFNATDHALLLDRMFVFTVEGSNTYEIETVMIILVLMGSGIIYAISACTENSLRDLFRYHRRMR